jgi:hypothetical protein
MASISRPSTTIKVSVETRDRIRDLGGGTYEETITEALDALETYRFWAQAEAAAAWRALLPEDERQRRREKEIAIDAALDRLW